MEFVKKLLSDSGEISAIRFMAITSLFFGFILAIIGIYSGKDVTFLVGIFVGAAFGGKVGSKFAEVKQ